MMDCFPVRSNERPLDDHTHAQREREARTKLLAAGADRLDHRPWQAAPVPPSAVDLIQFFLWRSGEVEFGTAAEVDPEITDQAVAALQLLPAARAELDQLEVGLLFAARGLGLTWGQMARALGLNSPQACQQRLDRLTARTGDPDAP